MASDHTFAKWSTQRTKAHGDHTLVLVAHGVATRAAAVAKLTAAIPKHYVDPKFTAARLKRLGATSTAKLFAELLPTSATARAGDLGEILATEYVEVRLGYRVPVYRLRWKDGRNMALRGDDVVAYQQDPQGLTVLKGEVKARRHLSDSVLTHAKKKLRQDRGRPNRHTVLYLATRLRELGQDGMADVFEDMLVASTKKHRFRHLVFTLSKNSPRDVLERALDAYKAKFETTVVGMHVSDYDDFITQVFEALNA